MLDHVHQLEITKQLTSKADFPVAVKNEFENFVDHLDQQEARKQLKKSKTDPLAVDVYGYEISII
jgi:hypothetical protein